MKQGNPAGRSPTQVLRAASTHGAGVGWNEATHPRVPAGSEDGGQFASAVAKRAQAAGTSAKAEIDVRTASQEDAKTLGSPFQGEHLTIDYLARHSDAPRGSGRAALNAALEQADEARLPVIVSAQDEGSGKLTRMYQIAGFEKVPGELHVMVRPPAAPMRSAENIVDTTVLNPVDKRSGMQLVELDMSKADEAFKRHTSFYVGPGGTGASISDRYKRIGEFFRTSEAMHAPDVSIRTDMGPAPVLDFGDGRHRFARLRDMGAKTIRVGMTKESARKAHQLGLVSERKKK